MKNGVNIFLGIPYAALPVGDLRWMPPVKHASWTKTLSATSFGPTCAQIFEIGAFAGPPNSNEDCLYLNVFTPNIDIRDRETLPVIFWSYGGGNYDGESNDYDGRKLALRGRAIVVTFNYRLNLFGYLAHPALDNEGHLFANYGLLDNQFALQWVKRNIANFGGDPNNVTIAGQSSGSQNSASEILSPLARGLFHKAILQSGPLPGYTPLGIAETKGTNFAIKAGCGSGATPSVAQCLRNLPASTIQALAGNGIAYDNQGDTGNGPYFSNYVADGRILPLVAITAFESGNFNHVPMIVGNTENDGTFFTASTEYYESPRAPITEAQFEAFVTSTFSGNAGPGGSPPAYPAGTVDRVLAEYPLSKAYPTPQLRWAGVQDMHNICPAYKLVHILADQVPLYAYEFRDQTAPNYFPEMPGFASLAYHTGDIQYYFPGYHGGPYGTLHRLSRPQEILSDELVTAWTNFAGTGNPNGVGNSPWPRYSPYDHRFFTEDLPPAGLSTETDAFYSAQHHCDFWDKVSVYVPSP